MKNNFLIYLLTLFCFTTTASADRKEVIYTHGINAYSKFVGGGGSPAIDGWAHEQYINKLIHNDGWDGPLNQRVPWSDVRGDRGPDGATFAIKDNSKASIFLALPTPIIGHEARSRVEKILIQMSFDLGHVRRVRVYERSTIIYDEVVDLPWPWPNSVKRGDPQFAYSITGDKGGPAVKTNMIGEEIWNGALLLRIDFEATEDTEIMFAKPEQTTFTLHGAGVHYLFKQ